MVGYTATNLKKAFVGRIGFIAAAVVATAVLLVNVERCEAQGQMTAEVIIGDAVPDAGVGKFPDVDEAIKRFINGDVLTAGTLLDEARKKSQTLPPTDLMLAKMYLITNQIPAGRSALEKTVTENPADPEAYILLADIDQSQGGLSEAEALCDKGLVLAEQFNANPKRKRNVSLRGRLVRAQVFERRKNWTAMESDLQALLKIDEHHMMGRYKLGVALARLKRFPEAKVAFDAARKEDKDKKLPSPWLSMALLYDQLGQNDYAKKSFTEALREDQNDLSAMVQYTQWLIKNNQFDEAEKNMAAALRAHPESLDVYILSGAIALMKNKPKEAEDFFVKALGMAPARLDVMNQLALLSIELDNPESKNRAVAFAELNAKANENSADARVTLAWVYFKLARTNDANRALKSGLQLGNLTPDSSYLVAVMISTGSNQPEQVEGAKKLLTEALSAENAGIFIHRKDAQDLLKKLGGN